MVTVQLETLETSDCPPVSLNTHIGMREIKEVECSKARKETLFKTLSNFRHNTIILEFLSG